MWLLKIDNVNPRLLEVKILVIVEMPKGFLIVSGLKTFLLRGQLMLIAEQIKDLEN